MMGGVGGSFASRGAMRGKSALTWAGAANLLAAYDCTLGRTYNSTLHALGTAPPVVNVAGGIPLALGLQLDMPVGGARGTSKFRWSADNGANWSAQIFTAASIEITPGVVLAFATGTNYSTDNTYKLKIPSWADLTGHGHTMANATIANQPRPKADGSIILDGSTEIFTCATGLANSAVGGNDKAHTIITVAKWESHAAADDVLWSFGHATDTSLEDYYWDNGVTRWRCNKHGTTGANAVVPSTGVAATGGPHIHTLVQHGTTADMYLDGTATATGTSQDVPSMTVDTHALGALYTAGTLSRYTNCSLFEHLVYDTDLGSTALADIHARLKLKWGIP